jgi:ketosteroid isomerase-like protein
MFMKMTALRPLTVFAFLLSFSAVVSAHGDEKHNEESQYFSGTDSDAATLVLKFHKALETGNGDLAASLLADDVLIFEGKGVERSAQEYASHHMLSDMKYLSQMQIEIIEHHVKENGTHAISLSRSLVKGQYKGKEVNHIGNETIGLEKLNDDWKITHIHWSN